MLYFLKAQSIESFVELKENRHHPSQYRLSQRAKDSCEWVYWRTVHLVTKVRQCRMKAAELHEEKKLSSTQGTTSYKKITSHKQNKILRRVVMFFTVASSSGSVQNFPTHISELSSYSFLCSSAMSTFPLRFICRFISLCLTVRLFISGTNVGADWKWLNFTHIRAIAVKDNRTVGLIFAHQTRILKMRNKGILKRNKWEDVKTKSTVPCPGF